MTDPIVEEVRKIRMEHTKEFGGDLAAICRDYREMQQRLKQPLVRLTPRPLKAKAKPKVNQKP